MANALFVLPGAASADSSWPTLDLIPHSIETVVGIDQALAASGSAQVVLVDGRTQLAAAKAICEVFDHARLDAGVLLVIQPGSLAALKATWPITDFVLSDCQPGELDVRIELLSQAKPVSINQGPLQIDEAGYTAVLAGRPLNLTYTEFELLRYLAQHPGRVLTRKHLLAEVWGGDYYGGTRTVDVHVRRLRAKLGPEYEACIATVRSVGYRFTALP